MGTLDKTMSWTYAESGDVRLDRQHETLIHITETLSEVIGGGGGAELGQMLCYFLERRLERHFRTEEALVHDTGDMAGLATICDSHTRILKSFAAIKLSIPECGIARTARLFNEFRLALACHDRYVDGPLFDRLGLGGNLHRMATGESAGRIPLYADAARDAAGRLAEGIRTHDG